MDSVLIILSVAAIVLLGSIVFIYGRTYQMKEEMKRRKAQSDFESAVQHELRKRKGDGGAK